jgi:hypothetical protein
MAVQPAPSLGDPLPPWILVAAVGEQATGEPVLLRCLEAQPARGKATAEPRQNLAEFRRIPLVIAALHDCSAMRAMRTVRALGCNAAWPALLQTCNDAMYSAVKGP